MAMTAYVVPASKPAIGQRGDMHVTVMGLPPLTGVAVTVNGPLVPRLANISTAPVVGPVAVALTAGALECGCTAHQCEQAQWEELR